MRLRELTEAIGIEEILSEFPKFIASIRNRKSDFNTCRRSSEQLSALLTQKGYPNKILRLSGYEPETWDSISRAHLQWRKMGKPFYWIHYVVLLNGQIIDLAPRQFDSSLPPIVIAPAREYLKRWTEYSGFGGLAEMAPTGAMRTQVFYHGTGTTIAAEKILQDGIVPGNQTGKALGQLTPMSGRTYLSQNLEYAIIYAIGGDMIGHADNTYLIQKADGDPYGYVFVISGEALAHDVQPDEDSVGEAVMFATRILQNDEMSAYAGNPLYQGLLKADRYWLKCFQHNGRYAMTPRQYVAAIQGFVSAQAAGGKRFLKIMDDADKRMLIQAGAHVSHGGPVMPEQCWRIDRRRNGELKKDGSNFFEVAERIK